MIEKDENHLKISNNSDSKNQKNIRERRNREKIKEAIIDSVKNDSYQNFKIFSEENTDIKMERHLLKRNAKNSKY